MVLKRRLPCAAGVFLLALLATLSGCALGQPASFRPPQTVQELDPFIAAVREEIGTVGMAAALVKQEQLLWSGGAGQANLEQGAPVTADSVFLVASVSKTVTAVAVMQLVEAGQLDLDADINRYLPFQVNHPMAGALITTRQLLAHTSGLTDTHYLTIADQLYTVGADAPLSLDAFLRAMLLPDGQYYNRASFGSPPGTAYAYSNLGYALLGYLVEAVALVPFDVWTQQQIFAPLGMSRTAWRLAELPPEALVMPYSAEREPYGHYTFPDYPNGGLRTSINDLSRLLRAVAGSGELEGRRILQPETVAELLRVPFPTLPGAERQAHGWAGLNPDDFPASVGLADIGPLVGHPGGERGVFVVMYMHPETSVGAIVAVNTDPTTEEQVFAVGRTAVNLIKLGQREAAE